MDLPRVRQFIRPELDADGPAVEPDATIDEVARLLAQRRRDAVKVVEEGRVLGGVSLFDLVPALLGPAPEQPAHDAESNPAIVLRFRKIGESQDMLAQFESVDDARTWLQERPKFVRVLRIEEPSLPARIEAELHDAMRPLDDEELDKIGEVQREMQRAHSVELRDLQARVEREGARQEAITPDSPYSIRFEQGKPLQRGRTDDTREIPPLVVEAVQAWVKRRNKWMHPQQRHVAGALLRVEHGADFDGEPADRVEVEGEIEVLAGFADEE